MRGETEIYDVEVGETWVQEQRQYCPLAVDKAESGRLGVSHKCYVSSHRIQDSVSGEQRT